MKTELEILSWSIFFLALDTQDDYCLHLSEIYLFLDHYHHHQYHTTTNLISKHISSNFRKMFACLAYQVGLELGTAQPKLISTFDHSPRVETPHWVEKSKVEVAITRLGGHVKDNQ